MKNWIIRILGITKLIKDVIKLKWSVYGNTSHQKLDMSQFSEILGAYDEHGLHGVAVQNAKNIYGIGRRLDELLARINRKHDNLTLDMELNRHKITEIERRLSEKTNVSEKITSMNWIDPKSPSSLGYSPWGTTLTGIQQTKLNHSKTGRTLSDEERLKAYKKALTSYSNNPIISDQGLCLHMKNAHAAIQGERLTTDGVMELYPEFAALKPIGASRDGYWWDVNDQTSRMDALKGIIARMEGTPIPTETLIGKIRESSANERLKVYRTALEYIKSGREDTLCNAISLAHGKIRLVKINILDIEDSYPELSYVRPLNARKKEYWWSPDDRDSRIIALDFIISYLSKEPLPRYLREKIYREALKMFVENEAIVGLCSLLSQAVGKICGTPINATNKSMIPELNKQKPAGESLTGGFWWPKSDRGSRKVALLNMISSVAPEKKRLSANERHDVYTVALQIYKAQRAGGLCNAINNACEHLALGKYTSTKDILDAFPEFERIRRELRFPTGGYWWDEGNTGARITVLQVMIEEAFSKI